MLFAKRNWTVPAAVGLSIIRIISGLGSLAALLPTAIAAAKFVIAAIRIPVETRIALLFGTHPM
jgi:hypothetical protein